MASASRSSTPASPATRPTSAGPRVVANAVTSPGAPRAGDGFGHGTHVAGIIAGNSFNRDVNDPLYGKYVGVAPDANLIAIKASDDAGNATVLDVINGIAFAVDHKREFNIRVLNLSLSTDTPAVLQDRPAGRRRRVRLAEGHRRRRRLGQPRHRRPTPSSTPPPTIPYVISVGGVDESGNNGQGVRADWSSTGRTQDGLAKPDVIAPGAHIVSVLAPEQRLPDAVPELRDRRRSTSRPAARRWPPRSSPARRPCSCRPVRTSPPTRSRPC